MNWPKGRAWVAVASCLPRDGMSHFDAEKKLSEVVMSENEEPQTFYQKLRSVQVQFPDDTEEKQMLNQFLRGSHLKYQASIIQEYKRNPHVTVESLADTLQVDHRLTSVFSTQVTIDDDSVEYESALT